MNISPSSVLIFLIPTGLSYRSLSFMSSPRLTWCSSSGKYFICFGRLWGHCCCALTVGAAHSNTSTVGGSDRRVEICILQGDARCKLVARVRMQGEECGSMLCKTFENLLCSCEVAGGASNARIRQIARLG